MQLPTSSRNVVQALARPLAGTALLAGTGALVGGFIGSTLLFLLQLGAPGGITLSVDLPFATVVGGSFGAAVGLVVAPVAGWTFLRHVPFGRAILGTAAGTFLGAAAALLVGHPAVGGIVGYAVAAVLLRRRLRSARTLI